MATTKEKTNKTKKILTVLIGIAMIAVLVLLIVLLTQKNGFVRENGEVYFYENNKMQVGWQNIDDDLYYFDADGKMHKGWLVWGKDVYYFRQGKGGDDIGGTLLINSDVNSTKDYGAVFTDKDGVRWYVEFNKAGNVTIVTLDYDWYNNNKVEIPEVTAPNFEGVDSSAFHDVIYLQ